MDINFNNNSNDNVNQYHLSNKKYVLLIGSTGSGKSTFVEKYMKINGLSSFSSNSDTFCPMLFKKENDNLVFIDTPGIFDSEGNTQDIYDKIVDTCMEISYINYILLFTRYPGRIDKNVKELLNKYTVFLGDVKKSINLCFTNVHDKNEINSIKTTNYDEFNSINNIFILNKNDEDGYNKILNNINENIHSVKIQNKDMRRIYTLETQLAKLKDDLRLQRKENQEDKEKIKKLEQLINNNNDYRYTTEVNSFLCPGIKNNGKRCTRTINCHWYQNYLDGNVKNAHKKNKTMGKF